MSASGPVPPSTTTAEPSPMLSTPDITPAQIGAAVTAVVGLAIALGVPLSHDKQLAIEAFVVTFAPVLVLVDALIRHSRAKYVQTALLGIARAAIGVQPLANALVQTNGGTEQTANAATPLPPYIK